MGRVDGKTAIVTGGGSGIGKASAVRLAEEGARVVVTDISEDRGNETVEEIENDGGDAFFARHDVSREEEWASVVAETKERHGGLDVLLNNAGLYVIKPLPEITVEEWENLMSVNVTGVFLGMKHAAPVMAEGGGGSIINLSSVAALTGVPGHTLYGASKGAVRTMTKDVAMEYARDQVRVNSLHPGYINTGMAEYGAQKSGTTIEELGRTMYPLGRIGEPEDVANTVLFLATDESGFTTGAEFVIDGGGSAGMIVGD